MINPKEVYEEKIQLFDDVLSDRIPQRVPILSMSESWHIFYAGIDIRDAFVNDPEQCYAAYKKYAEDVYFDGFHSIGNVCPVKFLDELGGGHYYLTENGLQIRTGKGQKMLEGEYRELIDDPIKFIVRKILPRKFEVLGKAPEEAYLLMRDAVPIYQQWGANNGKLVGRVEKEIGIPFLTAGCINVTLDIIMDYLRDFMPTLTDIRRRPQEVIDASEALFDWSYDLIVSSYPTPQKGVGVMSPLHIPTYLSPKQFDKFYFPYLSKMMGTFSANGYSMFLFMENDWTPYITTLQDLPDGKFFGLFEFGDLKEYKRAIGHKIKLAGGMPVNMLKYSTKEECIDYAKKTIDELAPGGRYIFSVDRSLLAASDCNPSNLIAVNEFVRDYAKY